MWRFASTELFFNDCHSLKSSDCYSAQYVGILHTISGLFQSFQKAKSLMQKKEEGNKAFKAGQWKEAYDLYTDALAIDTNNVFTNSKLYFNRATVSCKVVQILLYSAC